MDLARAPVLEKMSAPRPPEVPITDVQGHLGVLVSRVRRAGRRAWRYSWFSWGFLIALYMGSVAGAVSGLAFPGLWVPLGQVTFLFFLLPAIGLLALALRELLLGHRESRATSSDVVPKGGTVPIGSELGWTETVQETQKRLSQAKSEADFSIVPLAFGFLGLGSVVSGEFLLPLVAVSGGGFLELLAIFIPIPFMLALVLPIYRAGRRWIAGYQSLLDSYVRDLSRLEAEFFWRFAGVPAPP
jgi:hypothetical protein